MTDFVLSLPEASQNAAQVDTAFAAVFAIAAAIFLILLVLLIVFAVRYRRGSSAERGPLPALLRREIEIGWTVATTFVAIFIFWWFVGGEYRPAREAAGQLEIHVVAKQWMWKTEHPDGAREINALHIPVNTPVRLVMTSQDVIHSFYVPAFRLKQDVLPVRTTELVFTPIKTGTYHLFCAEFCGTQHSHMTGEIVVMRAPEYVAWQQVQPHENTLVREGEALYASLGCGACHGDDSQVRAPKLSTIRGATVRLSSGATTTANDEYLRDAILHPGSNRVNGFPPIMPNYTGLVTDDNVAALVAYIDSISHMPEAPP